MSYTRNAPHCLRRVDADGTFSHSPVHTEVLRGDGSAGLALAPTPGRATTLSGAPAGASVTVYDALGRLVFYATADSSRLVRLAGLPAGMHMVPPAPAPCG